MKKSDLLFIGLFSLVIMISAGFTINNSKALDITDDIKVEEFTKLSVAIPAQVSLELGNKHSLSIDASQSVLDKIEVKVKDGNLMIGKKNQKSNIKGDIKITVRAPYIEAVSLSGSGDIVSKKAFEVDELDIRIAGSGNIEFAQLSAEELDIKIAGSGNLLLAGKGAEEVNIAIAGSGNLNAVDFEIVEFEAKISGSGDCKVFVSGELNATIAGSGSVKYKGSPQINTTVSGSGKVESL